MCENRSRRYINQTLNWLPSRTQAAQGRLIAQGEGHKHAGKRRPAENDAGASEVGKDQARIAPLQGVGCEMQQGIKKGRHPEVTPPSEQPQGPMLPSEDHPQRRDAERRNQQAGRPFACALNQMPETAAPQLKACQKYDCRNSQQKSEHDPGIVQSPRQDVSIFLCLLLPALGAELPWRDLVPMVQRCFLFLEEHLLQDGLELWNPIV